MGPTAAGKTELAVQLAQRLPLHLISVDSVMVFRGMDIGSGKPDSDTLRRYPHALVDIRDPSEPWSAGDFVRLAAGEIERAQAGGRIPLLVGGTMLYFQSLLRGLAPAPPVSPERRLELRQRAKEQGWPALHRQLQRLDPASAARIGPEDAQRLERALGVVLDSGETLTDWLARQQSILPGQASVLLLSLEHPRPVLHQRLQLRLDAMMAAGLLAEVERLRARPDLHSGLPAMRAIGYRQIWHWLEHKDDSEATVRERILAATRTHLRRQENWLRRFPERTAIADMDSCLRTLRAQLPRAYQTHIGAK